MKVDLDVWRRQYLIDLAVSDLSADVLAEFVQYGPHGEWFVSLITRPDRDGYYIRPDDDHQVMRRLVQRERYSIKRRVRATWVRDHATAGWNWNSLSTAQQLRRKRVQSLLRAMRRRLLDYRDARERERNPDYDSTHYRQIWRAAPFVWPRAIS